jgi:hypothetical protein
VTVNLRVLKRLLDEIDRFDLGEVSLPNLQTAILGHGLAVELGQQWQDLVNQVEGSIEIARCTVPPAGQIAAVRPDLERLRSAARQAMSAEPADSE